MNVQNIKITTASSASTAALGRRALAFSGGQIAVLLFLMLLVASIPIWTNPLPPLSDYVNHLARMHVIAAINNDPDLARFYEIDWQADSKPDDGPDRSAACARGDDLSRRTDFSGRDVRAHHVGDGDAQPRFVWALVGLSARGFPLLYNHVFLVGLTNYMFGIGLALWALACWIFLRERHWSLRLAVSTLFVVLLFFCHFSALGVYGVGLLATEILRLWSRRKEPLPWRLLDFVAAGLPFLPVVPLLLDSPLLRLADEYYWERLGKIDGLIFAIEVYSDIAAFALLAIVIAGVVWAVRRNLLRFSILYSG